MCYECNIFSNMTTVAMVTKKNSFSEKQKNTLTRAILLRIDNSMWNEVARVCTKHYLNVFDIILFPKKTPNYRTFIAKRHLSDLAEHVKILFESWFLVDTRKEFLGIIETHIPRDEL